MTLLARTPFRRRAHRVLSGRAALEATAFRGGEHEHQAALVRWAQLMAVSAYPELDRLFAIPNGGFRMARTAGRLAAEGVRAGVPDLFLPVARGGFHGCWVEMKAPTKSARLSAYQLEWIERLVAEGYCVQVAYGADAGRAAWEMYLRHRHASTLPGDGMAQLVADLEATYRCVRETHPLPLGAWWSWRPKEMAHG